MTIYNVIDFQINVKTFFGQKCLETGPREVLFSEWKIKLAR